LGRVRPSSFLFFSKKNIFQRNCDFPCICFTPF
jgi:hypothetical protein